MRMSFRWFGPEDPVSLKYIRQIPGVESVVPSLFHVPVGEVWPEADIAALKQQIVAAGLKMEVIESVNIHEDIKLGTRGSGQRDKYIENYQNTVRRLAAFGVETICYNFMPIFDWTRTSLFHLLEDNSQTMFFDGEELNQMSPDELFRKVQNESDGIELPGWETQRLGELRSLFARYAELGEEGLWQNIEYFLKAVIPVCEEVGINMAIHPDDPPWPIFGLPRIITGSDNLAHFLSLYDSVRNGLTLCAGSLGADPQQYIPDLIRRFSNRIHFGHVRNLKHLSKNKFHESAHLSRSGSLDIFEIIQAYHDIGFKGHIRPDHGRMIWGEKGRAGYGLYDRALGANYILGLWEALEKVK